ncbi:Gfo/Idh/MocA family oxidoreductase [Caballeronia grimmiae]|uniref:Oxidoreductase n=1 Tax=Caballeronia grimmiae TaxID=1071679 RepID=A0A069P965_9BURK|nr:Gfo/Idh/MocA family oxidoreductase [Caballeronia grimmiae]KDR37185.1 oxidoreductase [Caballeronia grimmiae]GGD67222.1 oxidoreductase [Caballeronia grimmiae]
MNPVRVGIVGLGRLGRRHAENLAWHVPGARLVAACSPLPKEREWAKAHFPDTALHADYDALLADASVDAVWLVTPTSLHATQIIAALEAGKHVFCEKPLSLDLAECDRVIEAHARHAHLRVMIGFVRRFDASYRDAFDSIAKGAVGRPFMVRSQTCDKNDPDGFFVRFAPTSGGLFLDCSVHDIDLARWLLGNPRATRVMASGTIAIHEGLRECGDIDNGVGIVEFDDGRLAVFYASRTMAHGHHTQTEVIGTAGALSVGRNPRLNRVELADEYGVRNACTPTFFERFEDAFLREAQAFVAWVSGGKPTGMTLEDAREATRIGIALREAYASRRPVDLQPLR